MSKNKLYKFSQLATFPNVYQNHRIEEPFVSNHLGEKISIKGKWDEVHFKNRQPITLELACGGGEYTLGLSRMHPNRNFIGVDVKGARIWKGARVAIAENISNAAFLRCRIERLRNFFALHEVQEIWITFPDPFLGKPRRRLTSPIFLKHYREILPKGGLIHLKTDDPTLYEYTLDTLKAEQIPILYHDDDIYAKDLPIPELDLHTFYEKMHLEDMKTIKYVRFAL